MKTNIQIVETPIIDKYDFHENNGIINPAFLEAHPEEEDSSSSRALVGSDYRQCFHQKDSQIQLNPSQYPADDLVIEHRPNGTSVASSWVYEFNHGCSSNSPGQRRNMTSSPTLNGMYRPAYGVGYNDHLSYEMDLSRDHRKNVKDEENCSSDRCWPICIKLFVWTVIVVCLMGVFLSVAFIIYIERFAADTCCSDEALNRTDIPRQDRNSANATPAEWEGFNTTPNPERVTPALVDLTTITDFNTSLPEVETTPKVTTISYFGRNSENSSTDLWTAPNSPITTVINGQNKSQELNVTEVPLILETTETVFNTSTEPPITVPSTRLMPSITTHSAPTSRTKPTTQSSAAPTLTTENPIYKTPEKTRKPSFVSRFLTTNLSQTTEPDINSSETTNQMNGNKSTHYSSATTSLPEETTTYAPNETTTNNFDIVAEIIGEIEKSSTSTDRTSNEHYTTTSGQNESHTPSYASSDYTTANYNQTEPAINHETVGSESEDSLTTITTIKTTVTEPTTTTTIEITTIPTTTEHPSELTTTGEDED